MQVIPAVDVLDGEVVRLMRGSYDDVTRYGSDAAGRLEVWGARGASLVHVVDLGAARNGLRDETLTRTLARTGVPFQIGGGIRGPADAEAALADGAFRVVIGTAAISSPEVLDSILEAVGASRVVVAMDVADGRARGTGWTDHGEPVVEVASRIESQGVQRALVTGIAGDGAMTGPDLGLLSSVHAAAPGVALIGSGGVGSLEDLVALRDAGAEGAIVGRALYEGRFSLPAALDIVARTPDDPVNTP